MPFIQRIVEPTHVSRVEVGQGIHNELECVTNHSLANIIRQLSTLSKHAEDMFSELYQETTDFFRRASQLNSRVEHLRVTVTQLNPTEEIVSLQDIHLRKPYRSSNQHDQQVVSKTTISRAILETYNRCEKPPSLDKLNVYREDGKDCMKFYTDPGYFFELWFAEIKKDIDTKRAELKKRKEKRQRPNQRKDQKKIREVQTMKEKYEDLSKGVELSSHYRTPNIRQGGNINGPVPAGMVQMNTQGVRQQEPEVYNEARTHVPEKNANHIDMRSSKKINGPYTHTNSQYIESAQQNHAEVTSKQHRESQRQSNNLTQNHMSPKDRRNRNVSSSMIGNRPSMAPPPPPPLGYEGDDYSRQSRASMSPQRETLPPPPPPPPSLDEQNQNSPQNQTAAMMRNHLQRIDSKGSPGGSPIRYVSIDQELPPPPPQQISPEMPPPPPPILQQANIPAPPPPPPPPPLPPASLPMNTRLQPQQPDTVSMESDNSSTTTYSSTGTTSTREIEAPVPEKVTGRNALLEEIRLGDCRTKLRKAEDRKKNAAPQDKFDVHAVMTRAFEMRQKAMADSDSDEDDLEDDWE